MVIPVISGASVEAYTIANELIEREAQLATHATATCCVCTVSDRNQQPQHLYYFASSTSVNYENGLVAWVSDQMQKYSDQNLTIDNFFRLENPVFDNIYEARLTLQRDILPARRNPHTKLKRHVIKNMGDALDIQTGKDPRFFGKQNSIPERLELICGPNNPWWIEYIDYFPLNPEFHT